MGQLSGVTALTQANLPDNFSHFFPMLSAGHLEPPSNYLTASKNSVPQGNRSVDISKTCSGYLNLFWFSLCSTDRNPGSHALWNPVAIATECSLFGLLSVFPQILGILMRRQPH